MIPRPDAIVINIKNEQEYKSSYSKIYETVSKTEKVKRVRKTRTGKLLIEMTEDGTAEDLRNKLLEKLDKQEIKILQKTFEVEIRDLDPMVEREDIVKSFSSALNINREELSLKVVRNTKMGTQLAVIEVPTRHLKNIQENNKITIGMTRVNISASPKIIKCFRCHKMGHFSTNCTEIIKDNLRCRKCGMDGHLIEKCENPFCCLACKEIKMPFNHLTCSMTCPEYRRIIRKMKDDFLKYYARVTTK